MPSASSSTTRSLASTGRSLELTQTVADLRIPVIGLDVAWLASNPGPCAAVSAALQDAVAAAGHLTLVEVSVALAAEAGILSVSVHLETQAGSEGSQRSHDPRAVEVLSALREAKPGLQGEISRRLQALPQLVATAGASGTVERPRAVSVSISTAEERMDASTAWTSRRNALVVGTVFSISQTCWSAYCCEAS